jgi:hypothetical protein
MRERKKEDCCRKCFGQIRRKSKAEAAAAIDPVKCGSFEGGEKVPAAKLARVPPMGPRHPQTN